MVVIYAECERYEDEAHVGMPIIGVVPTIEEAQTLCQAYAQQRVSDQFGTWHLYWVEVGEPLTIEDIPGLIKAQAGLFCNDSLPQGDDTTPEEAARNRAEIEAIRERRDRRLS